MKASDKAVENELRSLIPSKPSPRLRQGIELSLKSFSLNEKARPVSLWKPLTLGLAASLVLVMVLLMSGPSRYGSDRFDKASGEINYPVDLSAYLPIQAEQRLIRAVDEGIVRNQANEPVRMFRYQFMDSVTFRNQQNGSEFTMEVPREEILLVPLSLI